MVTLRPSGDVTLKRLGHHFLATGYLKKLLISEVETRHAVKCVFSVEIKNTLKSSLCAGAVFSSCAVFSFILR
jgi:hypothetical protein